MKTDRSVSVFLGLGANLGEPSAALRAAYAQLATTAEITMIAASSWYWTDPVGGPADQPPYLNAVVQITTVLSPEALLLRCLEIEQTLGRVRDERWGPRTLDIDLLLYDDETIDRPQLRVPHPRMQQRAFVLVPLAELIPNYRHPAWSMTVQQHLDALPDREGVRPASEGW